MRPASPAAAQSRRFRSAPQTPRKTPINPFRASYPSSHWSGGGGGEGAVVVHGVWGNAPGETDILNTHLAPRAPEMNVTRRSARENQLYCLTGEQQEQLGRRGEAILPAVCRCGWRTRCRLSDHSPPPPVGWILKVALGHCCRRLDAPSCLL